jgi:ABC-type multidrug transport system fused ATPase/permease subunit
MFSYFSHFNILKIDFNKPWWYLIWQQKWLFLAVLIPVTIMQIVWSLVPFFAAQLFETKSFFLCVILFITWIILEILLGLIRVHVNAKFQLQCIHSIYQNAHMHLLTIDPKYHVYRSSGQVLAKIERAARGYEDFADHITFELIPLVVGLLTVVSALAQYSLKLAAIMSAFITTILAIGYYFAKYKKERELDFIHTDDAFKATALENLTQVQLIRATFASPFRRNILRERINTNMSTESALWISYSYLFMALSTLYLMSLCVLSLILMWHINAGYMSSVTALGLFLVYVGSSKEIVRFGRLLRKTIRSKTAVQDLFSFMPSFGEQTFPVLGQSSLALAHTSEICIQANNISFDYGKAILFNNHLFTLSCSRSQDSKLYGIIGASGTGKSTLLSILGGQLKPISGSILINNIDIYAINDADRSKLIALQGQVASNLYGTVKNNLLLGLPENHGYTDYDLLKILEQVGLLAILNQYNSLETILGEGGLNLSGGQRQRLNFASLYLRASFYKPLLVLIDEPTSSLDDISEAAITLMIERIAVNSVTLVVAHRLKTIQKAVGIIDLSLLHENKNINIYTMQELYKHSRYYQELTQGTLTLDQKPS